MNNKFLNKVCDQIISETRVNNDVIYPPFPLSFLPSLLSRTPSSLFSSHCKDVYSLNKEETEYVWVKYKEGITTLIEDKEPAHQEKRMMIHNSENNNIYGEYINE